jgi:hypothetical protein
MTATTIMIRFRDMEFSCHRETGLAFRVYPKLYTGTLSLDQKCHPGGTFGLKRPADSVETDPSK